MVKREDEGFLAAKERIKKGARGKAAEAVVHKILTELAAKKLSFDFDRLADSRACGRPLPQTVADFTFCCQGQAGALEVKETQHPSRLGLADFPQYPRMLRRISAGGRCILVVHHSMTQYWRIIDVATLPVIEKGSWDLTDYPLSNKTTLHWPLEEMLYARNSK